MISGTYSYNTHKHLNTAHSSKLTVVMFISGALDPTIYWNRTIYSRVKLNQAQANYLISSNIQAALIPFIYLKYF